jgi:PKD repeat protein
VRGLRGRRGGLESESAEETHENDYDQSRHGQLQFRLSRPGTSGSGAIILQIAARVARHQTSEASVACEVTITSVLPYGVPGQPLTSIQVKGTAVQCASVVVTISCGAAQKVLPAVVTNGAWEALFSDLTGTGCICNDPAVPLRVVAQCKSDPTCMDTKTLLPIPCQVACPTIDHIDVHVPSCDEVVASGGYHVVFRAYINGSGVTACYWTFGDQDSQVAFGPLPSGGIATEEHDYLCPGTYPVTLLILSDCEPGYADSDAIQITLPPCGCPTVSDFSVQQDPNDPCCRTFNAKIAGPFLQCIDTFLWDFGDGVTKYTDVPQVTHCYGSNGTYHVTLTMIGVAHADGTPCTHVRTITVTNCGGGHGNGDPCPWWNPFCHGWNLCSIILALALVSILSAGVLVMVALCAVPVSTPLIVAAAAAAAIGLALLVLWAGICRHLHGFCGSLKAVLDLISYLIFVQSLVVAVMAALALLGIVSWPCAGGAVASWAYYGLVYFWLTVIGSHAHCPPYSPPVFGLSAVSSGGTTRGRAKGGHKMP